ncbi:MAG: RAMP superfamily CRISPR-associated protein [Thermodesulfobacteriota bacterium]
MNYYCLSAELMACLMIQENRQTSAPSGLPYLPGSSLRGSVAAHYLRTAGTPQDAIFREMFINQPIFFPDMLPAMRPDTISYSLPATACSCKRTPGFKTKNGHGVGDVLADLAAADFDGRPISNTCDICQQDMKPFHGFWNGDPIAPEKTEPTLVYQRHTGIDRHTGTVAPSIFYITQGIADNRIGDDLVHYPQYLTAGVFLDGNQLTFLNNQFSTSIFAGADRTRGMGEMRIELNPATPFDFDLQDWNHSFRKKLSRLTQREIPAGLYFSIGLASHAIFVDSYLRPSCEFTIGYPEVSVVTRMIRKQTIRGWQSSWRLPKPEDIAVAMGGVYLFRYEGKDIKGLKTFLENLAINGIGLRRPEGFGRIQVCNPLHIQEDII